jgi:putative transcriptional regulator
MKMAAEQPVEDLLADYILGTLSPPEMAELDRRIAASPDLRREVDLLTEAMAQAAVRTLAPVATPATGRSRLLEVLGGGQRFAGLVPRLGQLFDLPERAVRALLDKVDDESAWISGFAPGLRYFNFTPGPRHAAAGAEAGFVRLAVGAAFPRHCHLGHETTLVIEGQMRDGDKRFGPGAVIEHAKDTEHGWVNDGPTELLVVSVHHGLKLL